MPYTTLSTNKVIETIQKLEARVNERFPGSGLSNVAERLQGIAHQCTDESRKLEKPVMPIRVTVYSIWTLGAAGFIWLALGLTFDGIKLEATSFLQVLDPAMNIAVLVGLGVMSLGQLEEKWKRTRALAYLHELRSLCHVVDMHQLTKDPYRYALPSTKSSPEGVLHGALLERYLDYCTEMLSLTGKLAALFAQTTKDSQVIDSVADVEQLATEMSQKIWQKIMAFSRYENEPKIT